MSARDWLTLHATQMMESVCFFLFCRWGHLEMAKVLVEAGARPEQRWWYSWVLLVLFFPLLARFSYFKSIFCTTLTKILFHPKHVHISLSSKLMAIDVKTSGRLVLIHWHGYSCLNSGWYGRRCNCNSKHAHRYSPPMGIVIIINLFYFKARNQIGDVFFFKVCNCCLKLWTFKGGFLSSRGSQTEWGEQRRMNYWKISQHRMDGKLKTFIYM